MSKEKITPTEEVVVTEKVVTEKEKITPTKDQETDLSFYKVNAKAYFSVLFVILFELFYIVKMLNTIQPTYIVGIFIMFNICVLLLLFTCALQVKVYHLKSSQTILGFGIYCIARVGILFALIPFGSTMILLDVINIAMGVILILTALSSLNKIKNQRQYIEAGKIDFIQLSK